MNAPAPQRQVDVAVLVTGPDFGEPLLDRLSNRRELEGTSAKWTLGMIGAKRVVCGWPIGNQADYGRLANAASQAHSPRLCVAAGPASIPGESSGVRWVSETIRPDSRRFLLATWPGLRDLAPGIGLSMCQGNDTKTATAAWALPIAEACAERGLPTLMITSLASSIGGDQPVWRNYHRQTSLAGRVGAVAGALWKRPQFAREALRSVDRFWSDRVRLTRTIVDLISGLTEESCLSSPKLSE